MRNFWLFFQNVFILLLFQFDSPQFISIQFSEFAEKVCGPFLNVAVEKNWRKLSHHRINQCHRALYSLCVYRYTYICACISEHLVNHLPGLFTSSSWFIRLFFKLWSCTWHFISRIFRGKNIVGEGKTREKLLRIRHYHLLVQKKYV